VIKTKGLIDISHPLDDVVVQRLAKCSDNGSVFHPVLGPVLKAHNLMGKITVHQRSGTIVRLAANGYAKHCLQFSLL
jgi:hypothetical protein